tara:strand:+ start:850 stop:1344 length:495 start_codon:yes stop_codon:yes gene_type:complete
MDMKSLYVAAQEATSNQAEKSKKKQERIQACIKRFNAKCDELNEEYFDNENPYSIPSSLLRACKKGANEQGEIELHMNFKRDKFTKWHAFVPFEADEYGYNYNARPSSCLRLYLTRAQEQGYLNNNIKFKVWGNEKFTVYFSFNLQNVEFINEEEKKKEESSVS